MAIKNIERKLPKSAFSIISRTLDSLVPTVDLSPKEVRRLKKEFKDYIDQKTSRYIGKEVPLIELQAGFSDIAGSYKFGSNGYNFYMDLATSIALQCNMPETSQYNPKVLR